MGRKLKSYVHVHEMDKDGNVLRTEAFGPQDKLPEWAHKALKDSPHVWADEDETQDDPGETFDPGNSGGLPPGAGLMTGEIDENEGDGSEPPIPDSGIPPLAGPGASQVRWLAYAREKGVQVDDNATKTEIVDAVTAAGVPTK